MSEADDTEDVTEARWREIVENYGERPVIEPPEEFVVEPVRSDPADEVFDYEEAHFGYEDEEDEEDEERFVPPIPAPLPRARPDRLAAWIGVLGSPAVVLVLLLGGLSVPSVIGWLLVAAFMGGFGYLVATMPREPRDPWDDGAQL